MQSHHKILFLPRWYPTIHERQNGVFIQKHAKAAAINNEVVVLFPSPTFNEARITESKNQNLTEIIIYYRSTSSRSLNILRYIKALFIGWRLIKNLEFQPELCHVNMLARSSLLALWLKWKYDIPFIISEHWSGYYTKEFEKQSLFKRQFTHYVFRKAILATVVSDVLKNAMIKYGLKKEFRILPNVVEVLPESWKQKSSGDKFLYLVVADLKDEIKNVSGVIRAFKEVNEQEPSTELTIVGDGKDRAALQKQAMESVKEKVNFLGEKSNGEVLKIIPTAHVIIVNSRIETFSIITLEAIFSGRPVIVTKCGGPERFVNEQNGILIENENSKELVESMVRIKNNYFRYPPEKVRNSVNNIYQLESIAYEMDKLYQDAIKKCRKYNLS